jgi:hypothetical protein
VSERPETWLDANQRHLAAAVGVVRALLERQLGVADEDPGAVDRARAALAAAEAALPAPGTLAALSAAFGLSAFERDVLVLCAAVELDSRLGTLLPSGPTFGLALALLPDAHWSAISPAAPLRRWHLVELADTASATAGTLRVDERVLHHLAGVDHLDTRLTALVEQVAVAELTPSHLRLAARIAASWEAEGPLPVIELRGSFGDLRRQVAAAACARLGLGLHALPSAAVPTDPRELDLLVRLWERDARLSDTALLVDCTGFDGGEVAREHAMDRLLEVCAAPLLVAGAGRRQRRGRPVAAFDVPPVPAVEQRTMWTSALGELETGLNGTVDRLVSQFSLSPLQIRDACAQARAGLTAAGGDAASALWEACRGQAHFGGEGLAVRVDAVASWDDLVLPEAQVSVLQEIASQVTGRFRVYETWGFGRASSRGLGISALFSGPSGTGKTMAAEVLAHHLRLDLYRIDLSQVVSKYIGETEKNLSRVFDAAEPGGAILLFDEADALFGKRSEVRDSHDRYANIEVSYLLQRMEAYRGLAILTTNLREALDPAFQRRLRFTVSFPFPDEAARGGIWRRAFPPAAPTEGLDIRRLARLDASGGSIRNIALGAAFRAAAADRPVRMADLAEAARGEYAKLRRPLPEAEVGSWI